MCLLVAHPSDPSLSTVPWCLCTRILIESSVQCLPLSSSLLLPLASWVCIEELVPKIQCCWNSSARDLWSPSRRRRGPSKAQLCGPMVAIFPLEMREQIKQVETTLTFIARPTFEESPVLFPEVYLLAKGQSLRTVFHGAQAKVSYPDKDENIVFHPNKIFAYPLFGSFPEIWQPAWGCNMLCKRRGRFPSTFQWFSDQAHSPSASQQRLLATRTTEVNCRLLSSDSSPVAKVKWGNEDRSKSAAPGKTHMDLKSTVVVKIKLYHWLAQSNNFGLFDCSGDFL